MQHHRRASDVAQLPHHLLEVHFFFIIILLFYYTVTLLTFFLLLNSLHNPPVPKTLTQMLKYATVRLGSTKTAQKTCMVSLVNNAGNPRVCQALLVPAHTFSCKPRVFPDKTSPRTSKTDEKWVRYA